MTTRPEAIMYKGAKYVLAAPKLKNDKAATDLIKALKKKGIPAKLELGDEYVDHNVYIDPGYGSLHRHIGLIVQIGLDGGFYLTLSTGPDEMDKNLDDTTDINKLMGWIEKARAKDLKNDPKSALKLFRAKK